MVTDAGGTGTARGDHAQNASEQTTGVNGALAEIIQTRAFSNNFRGTVNLSMEMSYHLKLFNAENYLCSKAGFTQVKFFNGYPSNYIF